MRTYEGGGVMQVAHVKPKGRYRSLEFVLENLVLLCKECHWKQHTMTYGEQQEFFARIVGIERLAWLEERARLITKVDLKAVKVWLTVTMKDAECRRYR